MKRVAIFGANGYLGRQLAFYFNQQGRECESFDLPEGDITAPDFWSAFDPTRYDAILFFAGMTGTERGFSEAVEYTTVNELGLLRLLNRLAPLGASAPRIIFPSSRLVYHGAEHPLSEDDPKEAKTVYAANKLACEHYLAAYHNRFDLPYACVRICVPYGNLISADYSYGTVGFFLRQAAEGVVTLYGDGSLRRTFTHVGDICEIVLRLCEADCNGVFNIGGEDLTLSEAAQLVAAAKSARVSYVPWPETALKLESGSTCFSSAKLTSAIGDFQYRKFSIN